eukprot:TRINITY_DN375_c0_g1_i1.p2 TRINITY_DN375_c0_g1~~TRINITY_DN375_c0_g1_i1.p2  ORF type:complete len:100 (-),score=19.06 TRINITY_DN375_c0_g1_i1:93-392(-)
MLQVKSGKKSRKALQRVRKSDQHFIGNKIKKGLRKDVSRTCETTKILESESRRWEAECNSSENNKKKNRKNDILSQNDNPPKRTLTKCWKGGTEILKQQ